MNLILEITMGDILKSEYTVAGLVITMGDILKSEYRLLQATCTLSWSWITCRFLFPLTD